MRRVFWIVVVAFLFAGEAMSAESQRPNILVILADDLADWHLGCYGNKEIRIPHIDRLAAEGVRMANSFVCTPVCSPSRATFFTGRVPRQHGIFDFLAGREIPDPPQGQAAVPESFRQEVMISDLLSAAGYHCGYIGKWHMGADATPQHGYQFWRVGLSLGRFTDPDVSVDGQKVTEKGYSTEIFTRYATEFIAQRKQPWFLVVAY